MRRPMSLNVLFLASALTLAFVPGCQDAPPIDSTPEPLGTVSQGLTCGGSLIPVMSARDNPVSGLVIASSEFNASNPAWHAVDGSDSTMWLTASGQSTAWLTYEFFDGARTLSHYAIKFSNGSLNNRAPRDWTLQGWSGSAWNTLDTRTQQTNWGGAEEREFSITTPGAYSKYRLMVTEDNTAGTGVDVLSIGRLSFYNCACATIVNQVPAMTSATAPSGTVTGSGFLQAGNEPWKAFDNVDTSASMWLSSKATPSWLSYEWPGASRMLTRYALKFPNGEAATRAPKSWTLQAWNGTAWVVVDRRVDEFNWASAERREYPLSLPRAFNRFKLDITDDNDPRAGVETVALARVEFLGCERDTTPPIVPSFSAFTPPSPGNQTAITLNGVTEGNATVRLFSGGTCAGSPIATLTATGSGAFSRALTVATNTTTTFSAKAEDLVGNVSACSAPVSYTHDNVAPVTPFQLAFVPSDTGSELNPQLEGRTEAGAVVLVFRSANCSGSVPTTATAHATTGVFSTNRAVFANTVTTFSVRAVDAAGNLSGCTSVAYTHDSVAPAAPTFTTGLVPLSQGSIVAGMRVQAEPRSRLFLFWGNDCANPTSTDVAVDSGGSALVPLVASQVGVPMSLRLRDMAGNLSPCVAVEETCFAGFRDCDGDPVNGCETSVMEDAANCGACGTVCAGAPSASGVCGAGTCGLACAVGTFDCDGSPLNGCESSTACAPGVCQVSPENELLITALPVVEDPVRTVNGGAWTFGTLMRRMNGGQNPSEMIRTWLKTWETNQVIAGLPVAGRPSILPDVLTPWETRSGGPSAPLDFNTAPFRLLAIVNRIDLRSEGTHSGEGRFVFGVTTPAGLDLPFTVILEYMLPGDGPEDIQRWARDWHELGSLPLGSPLYNAKLQALTDRFTEPFVAQGRFMGSAIHQVRTNENALNPLWELREFHFGPNGLVPSPVALTPELSLNNSPRLASFVQENAVAILAGTHEVPSLYQGQAFVAGSALTPFGLTWSVPGADPEVRHRFSLNTCNGCHAGETQTPFLHVFPRSAGAPSFLSPFLVSAQPVPDPLTGTPRVFNDLGRRDDDLETLVCGAPQALAPSLGSVGEGLLAPRSLSGSSAPKQDAVPGFPPRSNLPPGRVH